MRAQVGQEWRKGIPSERNSMYFAMQEKSDVLQKALNEVKKGEYSK